MKKRFKLKIKGESPRSLLLAFFLAELNYDVYLDDFFKNSNSIKDYQILLFSNYSKTLLNKFDIWNEIEDISYGVTSLSIMDNLLSERLLIHTENLSKKYSNILGWTANYLDIKSLIINKLTNYNNVHFISKNQFKDDSFIFDCEIIFKNYYKVFNLFKLPLSIFKRIDEQLLIFNVTLRGHVEKRLYEINTSKGLLVLTPLNKNLYQVIWNNASFRIKENSLNSKSLFLDNLTTLLPNELKIDQIIGDIQYFYDNSIYSNYLIKNNLMLFNENKFKSNTIYDFNFEVIIRYILKIYNFKENNKLIKLKILNKFGFSYLLRKYIELILNFSFVKSFFNLFSVNNIFSLFFRKLLFSLFKKVNFLKFLIMNNYKI